jgi:hypothetical protein
MDRPSEVEHRQVGQTGVAQVDALCAQHHGLRRHIGQQRADETRLPHTRHACDQNCSGVAPGRTS